MAVIIRPYAAADLETVLRLFRETIHAVNIKDYLPEQVRAWAPQSIDRDLWGRRLSGNVTLLAMRDDMLLGFGELTREGRIESMYVHKDAQRQGIATLLLDALVREAARTGIHSLSTEASITALPFFEHHGFEVTDEQDKPFNGQVFRNFRMERRLS